jgi:hypothetical protein
MRRNECSIAYQVSPARLTGLRRFAVWAKALQWTRFMSRFALIACTKLKASDRSPAFLMYSRSALFSKAWAYASERQLKVLILSAKHGLLDPGTIIDPYDLTLKTMPRAGRRDWAERVSRQLREAIPKGSTIELHAGKDYTEYLDLSDYEVVEPLSGLGLGQRLQWYDQRTR